MYVIAESATRLFCPPDSVLIGRNAISALTPSFDKCPRSSGSAASGNKTFICSRGVRHSTSWSTWCCEKYPIRSFTLRFSSPLRGLFSPRSSFTSVDLPAPFGPTRATRLSVLTEKSSFSNNNLRFSRGAASDSPCNALLPLASYAKETSERTTAACEPVRAPGSGNVKANSSSSDGNVTRDSSIFCSTLMRDWAIAARFALKRNRSTNDCTCLRRISCDSADRINSLSCSARVFSKSA
mmetsp:Transcript_3826/g.8426  ORF Transcript_3826/g.8426 Transcript_3826/m.8426 type:complete len:239 (+) Transcript_3826:284-1000(+)